MAPTVVSALTISTIGLVFKALIRTTSKSFDVRGLPILLDALRGGADAGAQLGKDGDGGREKEVAGDPEKMIVGRPVRRRGVVTVCNHNSVLDDPGMWAMMPITTYLPFASPSWTSQHTRWTLGASDIMFTNRFFSRFFTHGQVIETHRGKGVFQPAVDEAVRLVQSGAWVHIFPEGRVNQRTIHPSGGLFRFKWGVGRIVMDSKVLPEIIPMWISRFDQVMPETRGWPRLLPRRGGRLSVTVGKPITEKIRPLVEEWQRTTRALGTTAGVGGEWISADGQGETASLAGEGEKTREVRGAGELAGGAEQQLRMRITAVIQEEVAKLGREVEEREGRFERGEWSHSTRREDMPAPTATLSQSTPAES